MEEPVLATQDERSYGVLRYVIVGRQPRMIEEPHQLVPLTGGVGEGLSRGSRGQCLRGIGVEPLAQILQEWFDHALTVFQELPVCQPLHLTTAEMGAVSS